MRRLELFPARLLDYAPPSDCQFLGIGIGTASLIGGAISGGGSLLSGILGSGSSSSAAKVQSDAAKYAAQLQYQMFQQEQGNLQPYISGGGAGLTRLQDLTGTSTVGGQPVGNALDALQDPNQLTFRPPSTFQAHNVPFSQNVEGVGPTGGTGTPGGIAFQAANLPYGTGGGLGFQPQGISMAPPSDLASLRQTPGYQFTLDQGTQAVTNQNAALGLGGTSGALGKGLVNYAEGLASTTYNQQYNNWLQGLTGQYNIYSGAANQQYGMYSGSLGQQYGIWSGQNTQLQNSNQQIYNMLGGIAGTGQNAGVNLGTAGLSAGSTIGNQLTSGAAATAGGIIGSTNALTGGLGGAANSIGSGITNYGIYNQLGLGTGGGSVNPNSYLLGQTASGWGTQSGTGGF